MEMWFSKRREAHEDDGTPSAPAMETDEPIGALALLLAEVQGMVKPLLVYQMPYLGDGATATDAVIEIGRTDGKKLDDLTREVRPSNLATVVKRVMELPEVVGLRANAILAALGNGTLTEAFVAAEPVKGWRSTSLRTKLLMLVAFVLEAVFGARMAERLAGSDDAVSWLVGIAVAVLLTSCSLVVAHAVHEQEIGLLRGKGAWVALGVAVIAVAFLGAYAFGLGGGAEAAPDSGGLRGGTPRGTTSESGSTENWMLVLIYGGLLLLLLSAVVLSHLIDLYEERIARVGVDVASRAKVLSPFEQKCLAIRLLYQCLVLKDQSKIRALGLISGYVGGVRSELPPAVNIAWDTRALESIEIADPVWVKHVLTEIERLESEVGDLGEEPPFVLTSVS